MAFKMKKFSGWKEKAEKKLGTEGAVKRGKFELGMDRSDPKYPGTDDYSQYGEKHGEPGPKVPPLKNKQERQEKRRGRQLKRAKKKGRWMHGQEITGEKGQLKTLEDHSWSSGDKERKVKDPYGVISDDTPDYPSDDYRYYYKKNLRGDIKLLGKDSYPDLPPIGVKKKKKK